METSEWSQMHDRFYRKREVYHMGWEKNEMDLSQYMVAAAPFGGPVALVRDDKQIFLLGGADVRPVVYIYSSAGRLLSEFKWERGKLVKMGWTSEERLVCVLEDGTILTYSVHGKQIPDTEFNMGRECNEIGVVDAHVWGTGVVCLTSNNHLYTAMFDEPRPRALADPDLMEPPLCMCVLEPEFTLSHKVEVFLATESGSILVVDEDTAQDQLLANGPFLAMEISPNGKILACFTNSGNVWVVSTDFAKNLSEFGTQITQAPKQLAWCGTDSVVMHWNQLLLMVGPFGDWIKYSYDESLVLVPEIDGCRVLTDTKCEFIQRVPNSTESIFTIGSTAPAAMLYDAMDHFEKKSAKADENIRAIKADLATAVDECIDAACHEFDYTNQRALLKAAAYGKTFCDFYPADAFVEKAKMLRVLNALHYFKIGIPLTVDQYSKLTPEVLINRLLNRHHHLLAYRVCQYLNIPVNRVLIHWACAKVHSNMPDEAICDMIVDKLSDCPGISYAEIASTAHEARKEHLSTLLLDHEPRAAQQVPLLISMRQDDRALVKAIESGDTDLVYLVLMHIKRTKDEKEFFSIIGNKPVACNLFVKYAKEQDLDLLKVFYYHHAQRELAANICVLEGYAKTSLKGRLESLKIAHDFFAPKAPFQAVATEEQIKLLHVQNDLEREYNVKGPTSEGTHLFIDTSVSDTIYNLLVLGQHRKAAKLKVDFKVPDKRYWWLKVRALTHTHDWEALEKFAKEKKSPIGYRPFVELCIKENAYSESAKYILRLPDLLSKCQYYIQIGYLREAADLAVQMKDAELIEEIRSKMNDKEKAFLNSLLGR